MVELILFIFQSCPFFSHFLMISIMSQGRIFRDITLPEVSPAERSALYIAIIETLAKLHSFNVSSLGLQDYGQGAGYCKRQVNISEKTLILCILMIFLMKNK